MDIPPFTPGTPLVPPQREPKKPTPHRAYIFLIAASLILLTVLVAGAWLFYTNPARHISHGVPYIGALPGVVTGIAGQTLTLKVTERLDVPDSLGERRITLLASTTIQKRGPRKDATTYAQETKDYNVYISKADSGNADAVAYIHSHPYPNLFAYTTATPKDLKIGQYIVVMASSDVRNSSELLADQIFIESDQAPTTTPHAATAAPAARSGRGASLGAAVAYAQGTTYHSTPLHWSGVWTSNNFWCDAGSSLSVSRYDEGSSNNAVWYNCYEPDPPVNHPPVAPSISGPTSLTTGASGTYTFSSSDQDAGDTWGYGVDWNSDGAVDNWIGYPGNSIAHSWPSAGTYTFQALAQDNHTANSGWTSYTVTVSAPVTPPPVATLTASPASITSGNSSTLTYSCTNTNQQQIVPTIGTLPAAQHSGSVTVAPTSSTTYTLTCYGDGGVVSAPATVTVVASAVPDLTAGSVSPTSAIGGAAATFSATVSNIGSGSTGAGFTNLLQKAVDAAGTGATDLMSSTMGPLSSGASGTAGFSYAFPSSDNGTTKYLRVCADKSSAGDQGVIAESNEGNNCGAWTAVTVSSVPPPPAAPSVSFSGNPTTVPSGSSSTLSWSSSNATSCNGTGFNTGGATAGSVSSGALTTTTSYGLSCSGSGGTTNAPAVVITVTSAGNPPPPPPPPTCNDSGPVTLTASPSRVTAGQSAVLSWTGSNVSAACTVQGPGVNQTSNPSACNISGSVTTPAINSQSTYTLTCPGGKTSQIIVNIIPRFQEF